MLIEDYNEGDLVCSEYGLVLDSHFIDSRQEWRTSELDLSSESKARAEKSPDVFFKDAELYTTISKPKSFQEQGFHKNSDIVNLEKKYGVPKYRLNEGFNVISTLGDKLVLVKKTIDRALEIYKKLDDSNSIRGVNNNIVAISCLYTACKLEKNARTFKEIVAVANVRMKMRAIYRTYKRISQELQKMGYSLDMVETSYAIQIVRRKCSNLQMNQTDVKAILETVANSEQKLDIRQAPTTFVAATIFMITQLSTDKRNLAEISKATGVTEKTISAAYNKISPFTNEIVPQWFQNQLVS